jgi:hypothetical protein
MTKESDQFSTWPTSGLMMQFCRAVGASRHDRVNTIGEELDRRIPIPVPAEAAPPAAEPAALTAREALEIMHGWCVGKTDVEVAGTSYQRGWSDALDKTRAEIRRMRGSLPPDAAPISQPAVEHPLVTAVRAFANHEDRCNATLAVAIDAYCTRVMTPFDWLVKAAKKWRFDLNASTSRAVCDAWERYLVAEPSASRHAVMPTTATDAYKASR